AATWRHGIHESRITWLGIDELAARAAVKRELKTQGIEDFPKDDLFGRNALAIPDQLFEGLRIVARIPGDLGQGFLNCLHREWRRAEGFFIQRETRETACRLSRQASRRHHCTYRRQRQAAHCNAIERFPSCHARRSGWRIFEHSHSL